jgi:hypothetical protein
MTTTAPPLLTSPRPLGALTRHRWRLADGATTTVHVAEYRRRRVAVRAVALERPAPLGEWCRGAGISDALVGGFFVTPHGTPLGELWIGGVLWTSTPFAPPGGPGRSCVAIDGRRIRLERRARLPAAPRGDLLQAGPLLVRGGRPTVRDGEDPEGFSAGRAQFDSDITDGRHPRAALGLARGRLLAVVCEGRAPDEAGLTLGELASLMVALGARRAINLDGGGSAALVVGGELRNTPREAAGDEIPGGRAIATALAFTARREGQAPGAASS